MIGGIQFVASQVEALLEHSVLVAFVGPNRIRITEEVVKEYLRIHYHASGSGIPFKEGTVLWISFHNENNTS